MNFSPNPCQRQRRPPRQQDHGQTDRHYRRGLGRLRTERAGTARHVQCWRCTAAGPTHAAQPDQGDGLGVDRCRCLVVCSVVCCRSYLLILFVRCNTDIRCFTLRFVFASISFHLHLQTASHNAKSNGCRSDVFTVGLPVNLFSLTVPYTLLCQ